MIYGTNNIINNNCKRKNTTATLDYFSRDFDMTGKINLTARSKEPELSELIEVSSGLELKCRNSKFCMN